ncbi:MAG TPA: PKD domain-containing protein [Opitutaceae bacterium]|nr:PKD domain-containing protein [Opitutaceae bacterium]
MKPTSSPARIFSAAFSAVALCLSVHALERPDVPFKVFQFPADQIPRVDGNIDDWAMVPEDYVVGTDKLMDDSNRGRVIDRESLDVRVRVGWVKGLNRLYFLYEATDNVWDFASAGLRNDTFEIVVDGDMSGGPLIERFHPEKGLPARDRYFSFQSVHAQNYHIFTPAEGKDWCMAWGPQASWIKELPWSNAKCSYNFKPGQGGKLVLEFWVTPFDYAGAEGPQRAIESVLRENKSIGLCWAIIDYDDPDKGNQFWNLSPKHTMYGQASELVAFKLMPLEASLQKPLEAQWSFKVVDFERRVVAFQDASAGEVTAWKWEFGDGKTSDEQHPVHTYEKAGDYVVVLNVEGPGGKSRRSKVWDVGFR